jgi:outer membrane protein OmpA-like peptidoglycan-associated protein
MNLSKPASESGKPNSEHGASRVGLTIATLVVLGIGVMGYLIMEQMAKLEDRVGAVGTRVREMGEQVSEALDVSQNAADSAEEAMTRAIGAEENAAEAARTRSVAEEERRNAESGRAEAEALAASASAEADAARREVEQIRRERQTELDRLQRALAALVETRRTALGLVMNLGTDAIEFEFDRADLSFEERELLSRISGVLLTSPGYSIYIYGHTDDVGTEEYNQQLSERRAESVRDYIVESGISADIVTTRGYGQSSPRVEGTSAQARASNRRVEIGIIDVTVDVLGEVSGQ